MAGDVSGIVTIPGGTGNNPQISFGSYVPENTLNEVVRDFYERHSFSEHTFFVFDDDTASKVGTDEEIVPSTEFAFYFFRLKDLIPYIEMPEFVGFDNQSSSNPRIALYNEPSGFLTSLGSIMPRIFAPTIYDDNIASDITMTNAMVWTDNGGFINASKYLSTVKDGIPKTLYIGSGGFDSDDDNMVLTSKIKCDPIGYALTNNWVGYGAFGLLFNIKNSINPKNDPSYDKLNDLSATLRIGSGELFKIEFRGGSGINVYLGSVKPISVDLPARGDDVLSRWSEYLINPKIIAVYGVWNGVMISSGLPNGVAFMEDFSKYCMKDENRTIFDLKDGSDTKYRYMTPFDPLQPKDILITMDADVRVSLDAPVDGTKLEFEYRNCVGSLAYIPLFFSKRCGFCFYFRGVASQSNISEDYNVYLISTDADDIYDWTLTKSDIVMLEQPGEVAPLARVMVNLGTDDYTRYAPQINGYIIHRRETMDMSNTIKNGNGAFELNTTGADSPLGGSSNWRDYVTSVSVSLTPDAHSGSVSVDKYGLCGNQSAIPVQSVGALSIWATKAGHGSVLDSSGDSGASHTDDGVNRIFTGFGYGIDESDDVSSDSFTINLQGVSQKLQEMSIINAPYFDGMNLSQVVDWLSRYSGIAFDSSQQLHGTNTGDDVLESRISFLEPMINFEFGTRIWDCFQHLQGVVMGKPYKFLFQADGKIHGYQIDTNGLPVGANNLWVGDSYHHNHIITDLTLTSRNKSADLSDVRNYIVIAAMKRMKPQDKTDLAVESTKDLTPMLGMKYNSSTNPNFPWSKMLVRSFNTVMDEGMMNRLLSSFQKFSNRFRWTGSTEIPGNQYIRLFDTLNGEFMITGVTHALDFNSKMWTTGLELVALDT